MATKAASVTASAFRRNCEKVAEQLDLGEVYFHDGEIYREPFEDDGYLHIISRDGTRAVFNVSDGQMLSSEAQNDNTRKVMRALGMARKITENVLVEHVDDLPDVCPHCGGAL
jgi:hypothetical protein